jgi:hypothetical protein
MLILPSNQYGDRGTLIDTIRHQAQTGNRTDTFFLLLVWHEKQFLNG